MIERREADPIECFDPLNECGERFDGTEGWAAAADGYSRPDVSTPALLTEYKKVIGEYVARTGRALDHMRNFLDCVKSRTRPIAPAEGAHRANSTCQIANICLELGRPLKWNPEKEQFIDDPMADRKLTRAMRAPWRF